MKKGIGAFAALLSLYFLILTLLSGWDFAKIQFFQNWYWIIGLSSGFGVQVSLFTRLRASHRKLASVKVVAVSGTSSGLTMVACCTHYLANIIPIIGVTGLAAIVGRYQTEIFILGAAANLAGIAYSANKLVKFQRSKTCEA